MFKKQNSWFWVFSLWNSWRKYRKKKNIEDADHSDTWFVMLVYDEVYDEWVIARNLSIKFLLAVRFLHCNLNRHGSFKL